MNCRRLIIFLVAGAAVSAPATTRYRAFLLNPDGYASSHAFAIWDGMVAGYADFPYNGFSRALIWSAEHNANHYVDLTPPGSNSIAGFSALLDGQAAGGAAGDWSPNIHAAYWPRLSPTSLVDLHPGLGADTSYAYGMSEHRQCGSIAWGFLQHAALWSGSPKSFVDLNPDDSPRGSIAYATTDDYQAGTRILADGISHATIWFGSGNNFRDLHPAGVLESSILGANGNQQVGGVGYSQHHSRAAIWKCTAGSVRVIGPSGVDSAMLATNGEQQVGGMGGYAFVWSGTTSSAVNLHKFLPWNSGFNWHFSQAYAIDRYGNIAGYAYDLNRGERAVVWVPIRATPGGPALGEKF